MSRNADAAFFFFSPRLRHHTRDWEGFESGLLATLWLQRGTCLPVYTPLLCRGRPLFHVLPGRRRGGGGKNKRKGEKKGPRLISSFDTCDRDYQHVLLFRPPFSSIFLPLFFFDQKWHNCLTDRVGGPLVEMTPTDGFDSVRFFRPINWISAGKTTNGTKRKKVLCQRERNVSWRIEKETMAAK